MKTLNTNTLGQIGRFGENAAVDYLTRLGYELVGRNIVCNGNEIDIIVKDIRYIVFVEVKTRSVYHGISRYDSAAAAVDRNKQTRIFSAAKAYMKEASPRRVPRFDVIEVYVDKASDGFTVQRINHIPRAFGSGR